MASALKQLECPAVIRDVVAGDMNFIVNSWVQSYFKHQAASRRDLDGPRPTKRVYIPEHHALVAKTLENQATRVLIACVPDNPTQVVGYVVFAMARSNTPQLEPRPVYHYVYTKQLFRRQHVAQKLIGASALAHGQGAAWASHWSPLLSPLFDPITIEFNEYMRG